MFFVSEKKIKKLCSLLEKKKNTDVKVEFLSLHFFLPKVDFYIGMISMLCYTMDY